MLINSERTGDTVNNTAISRDIDRQELEFTGESQLSRAHGNTAGLEWRRRAWQ